MKPPYAKTPNDLKKTSVLLYEAGKPLKILARMVMNMEVRAIHDFL